VAGVSIPSGSRHPPPPPASRVFLPVSPRSGVLLEPTSRRMIPELGRWKLQWREAAGSRAFPAGRNDRVFDDHLGGHPVAPRAIRGPCDRCAHRSWTALRARVGPLSLAAFAGAVSPHAVRTPQCRSNGPLLPPSESILRLERPIYGRGGGIEPAADRESLRSVGLARRFKSTGILIDLSVTAVHPTGQV
jgi:hypothetical protein